MAILGRHLWLSFRLRSRMRVQAEASSANPIDGLFEAAPIGYLEIDPKGVVRRVNRKECELRGFARRELMGKICWNLLPPAERQRYRDQIERKMSGHIALLPYQRKYLRPDGSTITVEVHEQLLRDQAGRVVGMRLAGIDMTEGKKSEDQAYEAASELRALFQTFPDLFIRLDRSGQVVESTGGQSSDQFLSPDKFRGRNLQDLLPASVVDQVREAQEKARKTKAPQVVEFNVDGRAGQQVYETRLVPLDWEHSIATLRNITARKNDEKRLQEYAQELERKNEELESALVTARDATQLKSRFLANMSHEIRTPMNGVLGMTDFLLGTNLTEEQQEYAGSIKKSADALLTLINDILDLSRIEAGKLRLDHVPFSLAATVEESSSLFALQARTKGLDFSSAVSSNLPDILVGDAGRVRQVLTNLIGNAVKFTDSGRIDVEAEMLRPTEDGFLVRFSVRDTGIGIPSEHQSRLFESFTQGDGSSTRKYGGTGLGLSISKQLVELMNGELGVESKPGEGSRFWFTASFGKAPLTVAPGAPPKRAILASAPPTPAPKVSVPAAKAASVPPEKSNGGLRKLRVLLAEDNEINQRIALRLLEKLGLAADAVDNGRAAVEALAQKKYDLVLMDCMMPDMDGFEATAVIRNRERGKGHTPICALTANAMEGDREKCLAAGMDDYISKPVGLDKLREVVERLAEPVQMSIS
ncbi:MAG TPA: ATP-binding protein [Bryobacteraceae bacterium]|nr:ATP-binding protein [Bryobacteraceae bacterium]